MSIKNELLLEGLDCANCASKIEYEVNALESVHSATMNFINKTLYVELMNSAVMDQVYQDIKKIVSLHEPDVIVKEKKSELEQITAPEEPPYPSKEIVQIGFGTLLFLGGILLQFNPIFKLLIFSLSYLLIGGDILLKAFKNIVRGRVFDENLLMGLATLGAFVIGEYPEGVAVMLFYKVGEFFQDVAINRSRKSIKALMDLRPDHVNLKKNNEIIRISPEQVHIGDIILVQPGERIPLDGTVLEGSSMVDTSALTGESVPRRVAPADEVLSGMMNQNGVLTIETSKTFAESTLSKILDLVENASARKAPTEQFITKFARYYTPFVVLAALALALIPPVITGDAFNEWLYRALVFLVISCPCALVVSIPLGFFGGIGGASKKGILIKGGNYLEAINKVDIAVFDKTGTLTKGVFKVIDIQPMGAISKNQLLEYAAYAEAFSTHPIAISIKNAFSQSIEKNSITDYEEIPGFGITATVNNTNEILIGNYKLMEREGISYTKDPRVGTFVHVAVNRVYAGYLLISDVLKEDAITALRALKDLGVKKTIMLTGDHQIVAAQIAKDLGLTGYYAELLPHEKVEKLELIEKEKGKGSLIYVGDGINDAPVLARADVGIAMGGLGSDAAIEAADVVLMDDAPSKLAEAIRISRRTRNIVVQNIIFALGVKAFVLILGAFGIATMWEAVFADVGVTLIAVLNAMRALK